MFNRPSIHNYYEKIRRDEITNEIRSKPDSYILGVDTEEFTNYLMKKHGLPKIELDNSREGNLEKVRRTQRIRTVFDELVDAEIVYVKINIPIKPDERISTLLDLSPSSSSLGMPKINYSQGWLYAETTASESQVESATKNIFNDIETRNRDIDRLTQETKSIIQRMISERKSKIQNEEALLESIAQKISIPIKQKTDVAKVVPTAVGYSQEIKSLIPPKAHQPIEYILELNKFNAILNLIDNSCRLFERTPLTFSKLEEEELRNVILSNLNGVFEGSAVGEAFSKKGKTDIYLPINKGGVFIAECKNWEGPKTLEHAIQQILGYLTWRNSYGVLILFSKRKNFTDVLKTIDSKISEISSYAKGKEKIGQNHIKTLHYLPEDEKKLIEIHCLTYNLYCDTNN